MAGENRIFARSPSQAFRRPLDGFAAELRRRLIRTSEVFIADTGWMVGWRAVPYKLPPWAAVRRHTQRWLAPGSRLANNPAQVD